MTRSMTALTAALIAGVLAGCAVISEPVGPAPSGSAELNGQARTTDPAAEATNAADGSENEFAIDWDHPFQTEGQRNVDEAAFAASPQSFGMTIRPVKPQLESGKLRWIDVSAAGTVAYCWDFTGNAGFERDPRVIVEESQSDMTQDELVSTKWLGEKGVTTVGTIAIVVLQGHGPAVTWFVNDGTFYDIKGPALGPDQALSIATEIAKQLQLVSAAPS